MHGHTFGQGLFVYSCYYYETGGTIVKKKGRKYIWIWMDHTDHNVFRGKNNKEKKTNEDGVAPSLLHLHARVRPVR